MRGVQQIYRQKTVLLLLGMYYVLPICKAAKDFIRKQTSYINLFVVALSFQLKAQRLMLRLGLVRKHLIKSLDNIFHT